MAEQRETLEAICNHLREVNMSFAKQDAETNNKEYQAMRELIGIMQNLGCKVSIEEIWEKGLVSCTLTFEGVKF